MEELIAGGDLARAGALAVAHDDADALARIAMEVVRRNVVALPIDTVRPWSEALLRARPEAPETLVLSAALRQALDFTDRRADVDVDQAEAGFRSRADHDGEIAAVVVGTIGSYMRGDITRVLEIAGRAEAIPGSHDHPTIDVALRSIAAIGAEMSGDLGRALGELHGAPSTPCRRQSELGEPSPGPLPAAERAGRRSGGGNEELVGRDQRSRHTLPVGHRPLDVRGTP